MKTENVTWANRLPPHQVLTGEEVDSVRQSSLTVLEEVGIGLNEKARITGNMLEDEKIKGTCHLAPGNVRCHVDLLISSPTIAICNFDGSMKEITRNGDLI